MGSRPHRAGVEYEYARMLLSGETSESEKSRAREMLASARRAAQQLGMKGLLERRLLAA